MSRLVRTLCEFLKPSCFNLISSRIGVAGFTLVAAETPYSTFAFEPHVCLLSISIYSGSNSYLFWVDFVIHFGVRNCSDTHQKSGQYPINFLTNIPSPLGALHVPRKRLSFTRPLRLTRRPRSHLKTFKGLQRPLRAL